MKTTFTPSLAALAAVQFAHANAQDSRPTGNFTIQVTEPENCQHNGATLLGYHLYAGESVMVAGGYVAGGNGHNFSIVDDSDGTGVPILFDYNVISNYPAPCEFTAPNDGDNAAVLYCGEEFSDDSGSYYDASASTTHLDIADVQSFWLCDFATFIYGNPLSISAVVVGLTSGDAPASANLTQCVPVGLEFAATGTSGMLLDPAAPTGCSTVISTVYGTATRAPQPAETLSSYTTTIPTVVVVTTQAPQPAETVTSDTTTHISVTSTVLAGVGTATATRAILTTVSVWTEGASVTRRLPSTSAVVVVSETATVTRELPTTSPVVVVSETATATVVVPPVTSELATTTVTVTTTTATTSLAEYTGAAAGKREAGAVLLLAGAAAAAVFV